MILEFNNFSTPCDSNQSISIAFGVAVAWPTS